jgi:hypothetical protein
MSHYDDIIKEFENYKGDEDETETIEEDNVEEDNKDDMEEDNEEEENKEEEENNVISPDDKILFKIDLFRNFVTDLIHELKRDDIDQENAVLLYNNKFDEIDSYIVDLLENDSTSDKVYNKYIKFRQDQHDRFHNYL